jgi:hypothetical protein
LLRPEAACSGCRLFRRLPQIPAGLVLKIISHQKCGKQAPLSKSLHLTSGAVHC